MVNMQRMEDQLVLHEGFRAEPYLDTLDNWTIGVGYNLSSRGVDFLNIQLKTTFRELGGDHPFAGIRLTADQAKTILGADIARVQAATVLHWPTFSALTEVRQRVIVDLVFNMGFEAMTFVKCKAAIEAQNWSQAVRELYNSKWATQVGYARAHRLGQMLLTGNDYTA